MVMLSGVTAHAEIVTDVEPNDTIETAQLIQANYETAENAVNTTWPNQYSVHGTTSSVDEDWFKVFLTAGTQYITCNDQSFNFEVYDSNQSLILSRSYVKSGLGVKAFPFTAPSSGYYYVKVQGILSSPSNYILLAGGPTYTVQYCSVAMKSITLSGSDATVSFNLSQQSNLPDGAVVYTISMSNVATTAVKGISVKNVTAGRTVDLLMYTWQKEGLVSMNLPVKANWQVTFKYNKNVTITPKLTLRYAYPVTSEWVEAVTIPL